MILLYWLVLAGRSCEIVFKLNWNSTLFFQSALGLFGHQKIERRYSIMWEWWWNKYLEGRKQDDKSVDRWTARKVYVEVVICLGVIHYPALHFCWWFGPRYDWCPAQPRLTDNHNVIQTFLCTDSRQNGHNVGINFSQKTGRPAKIVSLANSQAKSRDHFTSTKQNS